MTEFGENINRRISADVTIEYISELSGKNPGALSVLVKFIENGGTLEDLRILDKYGLRSVKIWLLHRATDKNFIDTVDAMKRLSKSEKPNEVKIYENGKSIFELFGLVNVEGINK